MTGDNMEKIPIYTPFEVIDVLSRESDDNHVWWYITSLRGCDVGSPDIKRAFTCPLRGKVDVAWGILRCDFNTDGVGDFTYLCEYKYDHYIGHITDGYRALAVYYQILQDNAPHDSFVGKYYESCVADLDIIWDALDTQHFNMARGLIVKFVNKVTDASNGIEQWYL